MHQFFVILERLSVAKVEHRDLHAKNLLYDFRGYDGNDESTARSTAVAESAMGSSDMDRDDDKDWSKLRVLLTDFGQACIDFDGNHTVPGYEPSACRAAVHSYGIFDATRAWRQQLSERARRPQSLAQDHGHQRDKRTIEASLHRIVKLQRVPPLASAPTLYMTLVCGPSKQGKRCDAWADGHHAEKALVEDMLNTDVTKLRRAASYAERWRAMLCTSAMSNSSVI